MAACGNQCVDMTTDPRHCGGCGEACDPGWICGEARCHRACDPGEAECDDECVDIRSDREHCGGCFTQCEAREQCVDGDCMGVDGPLFVEGVRQDVAPPDYAGWEQCYSAPYDRDNRDSVVAILGECRGDWLMMACRRIGEDNLVLAAMGSRDDVTRDVGDDAAASHDANGVQWYYSAERSWGFAPVGVLINRSSCDFGRNAERRDERMCWHMDGGRIQSGYRCGDNDLNGDAGWEKLLFQVDLVE